MRVGINQGPAVAGIVGSNKFQFDIWGDTVNVASRMEMAGEPGRVNVSEAIFKELGGDPDFTFEARGEIPVKGRGDMEMYFVSLSSK
jgi:adenylate cyclase